MSPRRSAQEISDELKELAARSTEDRDRLSLLHEVQVYQEELTVQNEQLTRAQMMLEETRDHYIELYDYAPNGYLSLDPHGLIRRINLTGAALIGNPSRPPREGGEVRCEAGPLRRPGMGSALCPVAADPGCSGAATVVGMPADWPMGS